MYVDLDGNPRLAGRLHPHRDGEHEQAAFEADRRWRRRPEAPLLAPLFTVFPGPQRTGASMPLFGAVGDSAPDRWGRTLMRRMERRRARMEKREPRVLREPDFLLGVDDVIRAGCLRFAERVGGPFLGARGRQRLPRFHDLARLQAAVHAHEADRETLSQAQLLLTSGQLLGGSRPKATLVDQQGALWIAKFASHGDGRDMQRWEALVLGMAADCGIAVPDFRLVSVGGERVLLLRRFDRAPGNRRVPIVSAYGLLAAQDNEAGSYVGVARLVRTLGANAAEDLRQLFRRTVFAVLVSDKDNHLRNHGLVMREGGWRLCPAYDVNAEPQPLQPHQLLMSIDGVDDRADVEVALASAGEFGLTLAQARREVRALRRVVATWRERARAMRLPADEIEHMRPAFEPRW